MLIFIIFEAKNISFIKTSYNNKLNNLLYQQYFAMSQALLTQKIIRSL